jgi:dihydroorotate dehydrogenase (NAD+) catalytic subunit
VTRRGPGPLPPVLLGPGAVTDPRALARFGDLTGVPLAVGPVESGSRRTRTGRPVVHRLGVGGLDHEDVRGISVHGARELLGWASARGLSACLAVRGETTGDLAAVVESVHRSIEGDVVDAVEVDLRGADDQTVLRSMSRVREAAPRDQQLLARLSAGDPELVACARAAVAGGASAVIVAGQVPLGPSRWWSGPSTAASCLAGLRTLRVAATDQRWPGAPLVAAGGVHGVESALDAVAEGAAAVQLGSALWADPTLLWVVRDAVTAALAGSSGAAQPHPQPGLRRQPWPDPPDTVRRTP